MSLTFGFNVNAGSVSIRLSNSNPSVGETVLLTINCEDISATPSQISSLPGFQVRDFSLTGQSSQTVFDGSNYYSTQKLIYTVTMVASKEGNYSYGPIDVGGTKSNTISYTIRPGTGNSSQSQPSQGYSAPVNNQTPALTNPGNDQLFLRAYVSNSNPYEQQPVVYTVKLYTTYNGVQTLGSTSAPSFENCTSEVSNDIDTKLTVETYNGRQYYTAVVMKYILFPTHAGPATIKGNVISFVARTNSMFGGGQIDVEVPEVTMNIKPLPTPSDGKHINGVGNFTVRSNVGSRKAGANQVYNIKYIVSGTGNLNFVTLPDLQSLLPEDVKVVKTDSKINKNLTADNLSGSVEYTVSLIPSKEGSFDLPSLKFLFFNPSDGQFYTAKADGASISVGKSVETTNDSYKLSFNEKLQNIGKLDKKPSFVIGSFGYYLIYIIPLILLISLILIYRRHVRINSDVVGLRRKKAGKVALMRLKKSEYFMHKGRPQEFYAETLKALWGYLANKLNIPVADLSRDNINDKLLSAGASPELVKKVINVIDNCEMARYASGITLDMKAVYGEASNVINELEDVMSGTNPREIAIDNQYINSSES